MNVSRDKSIDIVKGIGILLVVMCHANFAPASPGRFFHMALFFFLSGYLSSYQTNLGAFVKNKLKHLYVPFLVCELAFILLHNFFYTIGIVADSYDSSAFIYAVVRAFCFDNSELLLAPLWYLPALFFANLLTYALIHFYSNKRVYALLLSLLLLFVGIACSRMGYFQLPNTSFKEAINVVLVAQFFCVLGRFVKATDKIKFSKLWIAGLSVLYLVVARLWLGLSVDMRINHYSSVLLWFIAVGGGIYATMLAAKMISRFVPQIGRVVAYLGKNSLMIFLLHILCFKIVGLVQVHLLYYSNHNLSSWEHVDSTGLWGIIYTIVGVSLPLFLRFIVIKLKEIATKKFSVVKK